MAAATVRRDGEALVFDGALLRTECAALWRQASALAAGARRFELGAVEAVDSAGLALLAELAERCGGVRVHGAPPGLSELRAAYRLDEALAFAS
ncbi:MAG TPA: STAS domain-containing protein [Lysobacter sp.]|nr:STAS domain-containing protein [Lysobacter sp.]